MPAPTMAYSLYQSVLVAVHTKDNPSEEEWNGYVEFGRKHMGAYTSSLIISEGGGPNATQRGAMNDLLEANHFKGKVSVVTLNRLVRGIVTAISWFNPNIKAFTTVQIPAAIEYLEIPKDQHERLMAEIKRLRDKLGISTPMT
jgi:hypothetical protein